MQNAITISQIRNLNEIRQNRTKILDKNNVRNRVLLNVQDSISL